MERVRVDFVRFLPDGRAQIFGHPKVRHTMNAMGVELRPTYQKEDRSSLTLGSSEPFFGARIETDFQEYILGGVETRTATSTIHPDDAEQDILREEHLREEAQD